MLSSIARSALTAFMKTLSKEVAPFGITVNTVLPGGHETDRMVQLVSQQAEKEGMSFEQAKARAAGTVPAGRLGDPSDFGAVVAFLASRQAKFITGTNIVVDGGACSGLL
jgi:3-oxoacyl-[acyl-carrier protein] reductase